MFLACCTCQNELKKVKDASERSSDVAAWHAEVARPALALVAQMQLLSSCWGRGLEGLLLSFGALAFAVRMPRRIPHRFFFLLAR